MKTRWLLLIAVALTSYAAGALTPVALGQSSKAPKYVSVAFMKVPAGKEAPYLSLEKDVWTPVHRKLIASGAERAWTLYSVSTAGTSDPYNYVTIQEFDSLDQYFGADYRKAFTDAHPGKSVDSIIASTVSARDEVAVRIMERLDHVE